MKSKPILFTLVLFIGVLVAEGQTLRRPVAAPYIGLGAYSINHVDILSVTANQASLAQLKNSAVGAYGERRFLQNELNNYAAVVGVTTQNGNFGIKAGYAGFSDYNETQLGLAYARKLGNKIDAGVQFNYNGIQVPAYGNASAISFEIGTIMHVSEKLHAGVHVNNPVGGKFGKEEQEKLPSVFTFGIGYDASQKFFISFEVEKEEDQPVNVNAGFQYKLIQQLLVRGGISSATSSYWMGLGLQLNAFRIDVTSSYHSQLGMTPGLLLLFNFNEKKN